MFLPNCLTPQGKRDHLPEEWRGKTNPWPSKTKSENLGGDALKKVKGNGRGEPTQKATEFFKKGSGSKIGGKVMIKGGNGLKKSSL